MDQGVITHFDRNFRDSVRQPINYEMLYDRVVVLGNKEMNDMVLGGLNDFIEVDSEMMEADPKKINYEDYCEYLSVRDQIPFEYGEDAIFQFEMIDELKGMSREYVLDMLREKLHGFGIANILNYITSISNESELIVTADMEDDLSLFFSCAEEFSNHTGLISRIDVWLIWNDPLYQKLNYDGALSETKDPELYIIPTEIVKYVLINFESIFAYFKAKYIKE